MCVKVASIDKVKLVFVHFFEYLFKHFYRIRDGIDPRVSNERRYKVACDVLN